MKRIPLVFLTVWSTMAAAEPTFAGTKRDIVTTPSGSSGLGVMPLVQLLLALTVVFVLIRYLLPKVVSRVGKRLVTKVGGAIKIEESASFGGGMLYVVEARGKTLLLGVGTQGIACLADLTDKSPQEDQTQTFGELLDQQPEAPLAPYTAVALVPETPERNAPNLTEVEAKDALARLRRLVD